MTICFLEESHIMDPRDFLNNPVVLYHLFLGFLWVLGVEPKGGGGTLGNPEDSGWEDWGTLGKTRGISAPP